MPRQETADEEISGKEAKKRRCLYGCGGLNSDRPPLEKAASSSSGMGSTGEGGMLILEEVDGDRLCAAAAEGDWGGVR